MKQKILLIISLLLIINGFAQKPELSMFLLGNDNIAAVNVEQDKFIAGIKPLIDLVESEFNNVPSTQAIGLHIICHKKGAPTIQLFSIPQLPSSKHESFLKKAKAIKLENTKIVDFPMLITLNSDLERYKEFGIDMLHVKRGEEYSKADLKGKYELNRQWAASEVLPVLAAYEAATEEKFAGVKYFGTAVAETDFTLKQDVAKLTSVNPLYWRAVMEMDAGNQLIPITKIFILASQGQFDHAQRYAEILRVFSDPNVTANSYLEEWKWRMSLFDKELSETIEKGIVEHDAGNYSKAVEIYTKLLESYPNSAWALYELYYSKNELDIKNGVADAADRKMWDEDKIKIYACNPLYSMNVRASSGKEGYLLFRRQEVSTLFKDDNTLRDVYEYADIALDLEVYDFAAQLFWLTFTFDKENKERSLNRYLYCLEKLGVKEWKSNFKGDFVKIFRDIEKEKEQIMKNNSIYKSFRQ